MKSPIFVCVVFAARARENESEREPERMRVRESQREREWERASKLPAENEVIKGLAEKEYDKRWKC